MRPGILGLALCLGLAAPGCESKPSRLRLATTTSTQDTGLLDKLLPPFEREAKTRVEVIAVGTGKALELAEAGDVDVVLVHARAAEDAFMAAGLGARREDVMHNNFELLGPPGDPAKTKDLDITEALTRIKREKASFASRGDDSGTHKKELALWNEAGGLEPWEGYFETGQGMGQTLIIAMEKQAYVLADRGTYLAFKTKIELVPLAKVSEKMLNRYGVIVVSKTKNPKVEARLANTFVDYLISPRGQRTLQDFTLEGERLFVPAHRVDD